MANRAVDFHKTDPETLSPKRGARSQEFSCVAPRGLYLRCSVGKTGSVTRSWLTRCTRPNGAQARAVHGHWPSMTFEGAAVAHKAVRELVEKGLDPVTERAAEQLRLDGRTTVKEAIDAYIKARKAKLAAKTIGEYERILRRHLEPVLGERAIADVTREDIKTIIRTERAKLVTAGVEQTMVARIHSAISALFSWACSTKVELIPASPVPGAKEFSFEKPEADPRPLEDDELVRFWTHLDRTRIKPNTKAALRLLLLTGCRGTELLNLKRSDVNFAAKIVDPRGEEDVERGQGWIRLTKTKGGKARKTPLTELARGILAEVLKSTPAEGGSYLFPSRDC